MINLTINGQLHELDVPDNMPLLWAIRDVVGMKGTKFGCGIAQCGACTVHLDGVATRSCITPVSAAQGEITTIEAMADDPVGSKVQQAWLDLGVAQCGYCQGGQIMNATALLRKHRNRKPRKSSMPWRATSAGVAPTIAFWRPLSGLRTRR